MNLLLFFCVTYRAARKRGGHGFKTFFLSQSSEQQVLDPTKTVQTGWEGSPSAPAGPTTTLLTSKSSPPVQGHPKMMIPTYKASPKSSRWRKSHQSQSPGRWCYQLLQLCQSLPWWCRTRRRHLDTQTQTRSVDISCPDESVPRAGVVDLFMHHILFCMCE